MSSSPLDDALRSLSQFVLSDADLQGTLEKVAELTTRAVPPAVTVGYSLLDHEGNPSTPVCTDARSSRIDQAQYDDGTGPCLDAAKRVEVIRVDDVRDAAGDMPAFAAAAEAEGILSTLSMPLVVSGKGIGALNLYAERPGAFSERDEAIATELAVAVSVLLTNVTAYWHARSMSEHLAEAMKNRAVIEQAKGIIMAKRRGLDSEAAFDVLRLASQRENRKVRDVAQAIVDHHVGSRADRP